MTLAARFVPSSAFAGAHLSAFAGAHLSAFAGSLLSAFAVAVPSAFAGQETALVPGPWRGALVGPGGEVPFGLELELAPTPTAHLLNGAERLPVPRVEVDGRELVLGFDHFDARIAAEVQPDGTLAGEWVQRRGPAKPERRLPFRATPPAREGAAPPRFPPAAPADPAAIAGRWRVDFASSDLPAVGVFEAAPDGALTGTFLTATGDFRFLAGDWTERGLRLSCFDGAHAFLFTAELDAEGALVGDFWSADSWHETWRAVRDPDAALPDPFAQAGWRPGWSLADIVALDLEGRPRALNDPAFDGRARILQVFGSWCPNCHDELAWLAEFERAHRGRGLAVLGLAFEYGQLQHDTRATERDLRQVRRSAERHGADYPLWLAGPADKGAAAEALGALERVLAFPTTVFLSGDGTVRAVHSGFAGPGTGDAHTELAATFEALVDELLAEPERDLHAAASLLPTDLWRDRERQRFVRFAPTADGRWRWTSEPSSVFAPPQGALGEESGEAEVAGLRVSAGGVHWHLDRRSGVFLDPLDAGHRLVPAARPTMPWIDGAVREGDAALRACLSDPDPIVRREGVYHAAVRAADPRDGGLQEPPFDPTPHLADDDVRVRRVAAWAVGAMRYERARAELEAQGQHPHLGLRLDVERALARLDAALVAPKSPEQGGQ